MVQSAAAVSFASPLTYLQMIEGNLVPQSDVAYEAVFISFLSSQQYPAAFVHHRSDLRMVLFKWCAEYPCSLTYYIAGQEIGRELGSNRDLLRTLLESGYLPSPGKIAVLPAETLPLQSPRIVDPLQGLMPLMPPRDIKQFSLALLRRDPFLLHQLMVEHPAHRQQLISVIENVLQIVLPTDLTESRQLLISICAY